MGSYGLWFLILVVTVFSRFVMAEPVPVKTGAGSFASEPPMVGKVAELLAKKPMVEKESAGRPLPSNDWWTSLLWDAPFPGKMFAYPLIVSADAGAVKIWYPKGWSNNGCELEQGDPLLVMAVDPSPPADSPEVLICDFEDSWEKMGWKIEGDAFGTEPMTDKQHHSVGFSGGRFGSSFARGDAGLGKAESPSFTLDRDYIHLQVAGGGDRSKLGVHLMVDGKSVFQEVGKNNNDFTWRTWDVKQYRGKKAAVCLVDETRGGWGFISVDQVVLSRSREIPKGGVFSHASTVRWGDWSVVMRLNAAPGKFADVTFGRGMPYVWIESTGLDLQIPTGDGKLVKGTSPAMIVLERDGRHFGLHIPDGAVFQEVNGVLRISFKGKKRFLAVNAMENQEGAEVYHQYAFAVPRDTRFDWRYDPSAGVVLTGWQVNAEAVQGSSIDVLQGWIPHHYRTTRNDLKFTGQEFQTRRGRMRVAAGKSFRIAWNFNGMLPAFPLPTDKQFNRERLGGLIDKWGREMLAKPADQRHAKDTYWGGKSMLKTAQAYTMAKQLGLPITGELKDATREILTDWLTYTPGEKAFYYARYPAPWNALVGFNSSFGSENFTDNHFHYGYLVMAAALFGAEDPEWLAGYGEAAGEVAKQYADWKRDDPDFPRLRTFEPWVGHSYAGGSSNPNDGNNQESSSEAIGSWAGMFFLGSVLGDDNMLATGAMGYAIETEAFHEYWNNSYGWKNPDQSNWPESYKPTICSVIRDRDMGAWTWFSGEPIHIYGIQWLPVWTHCYYFGRHKDHAAFQFEQMMLKQGKGKGALTYADLDADWGQVAIGYALWSKNTEVCAALDDAFEKGWKISGHGHAGIPYYLAQTTRALGDVDWDSHTSLPTSLVFRKADGRRTAVLWNPKKTDVEVKIFVKGKESVTATCPAGALKSVSL